MGQAMTRREKIAWGFGLGLSLIVISLMGTTGARIRRARIDAKLGREAGGEEATRLSLSPGEKRRVGHLALLWEGILTVFNAKGEKLAEFSGLRMGDVRRWQELEITVIEARERALTLEVQMRPGAPSLGPGVFYGLRPWMRIELPKGRSITVRSADGRALTVRQGEKSELVVVEGEQRVAGLRLRRLDPPAIAVEVEDAPTPAPP